MPNHVYSQLTVAGNKLTLKAIREEVKEEVKEENGDKGYRAIFSFNKIIPMPKNVDWYDWSCDNWGSKWNAYGLADTPPRIENESNALNFILDEFAFSIMTYKFETAWSPVPKVIKEISKRYPDTILRYSFVDEGGGFAGVEFFHDGELIDSDHREDLDESIFKEFYEKPTNEKLFKEIKEVLNEI